MEKVWVDITSLCRTACSQLDDKNPSISSPNFSLHDSMHAIELMDPKMDQCCGITGEVDMLTLLRVDYEGELSVGSASKLLAVLLNFEVAYYEGASILESLHLCKLMWPESWPAFSARYSDLLSRAVLLYCKFLYLSTTMSYKGIYTADVFEDEDFAVVTKPTLDRTAVKYQEIIGEFQVIMGELVSRPAEEYSFIVAALNIRKTITELIKNFEQTVEILTAFKGACKESNHTGLLPERFPDMDALHAAVHESATAAAVAAEAILKVEVSQDMQSISPLADASISCYFAPTLVKLTQPAFIRKIVFKPLQSSLKFIVNLCKQFIDIVGSSRTWYKYSGLDVEGKISRGDLILTFDTLLGECIELTRLNLCALVRSFQWSCLQIYRPITALLFKTSMAARKLPMVRLY